MSDVTAKAISDKPDRLIPETWFRASASNTTMMFLETMSGSKRVAALREGEREIGWFVLPPFQRPPVWTLAQKSRFIESCWMGLPIGAFIYNRPSKWGSVHDNWLLDGQQRITAIIEYKADAFPVFGHLYSALSDIDHRRWGMGISFPSMVTNIDDEGQLREVYDRLAYGGTPHEPKPTTQQMGEE